MTERVDPCILGISAGACKNYPLNGFMNHILHYIVSNLALLSNFEWGQQPVLAKRASVELVIQYLS